MSSVSVCANTQHRRALRGLQFTGIDICIFSHVALTSAYGWSRLGTQSLAVNSATVYFSGVTDKRDREMVNFLKETTPARWCGTTNKPECQWVNSIFEGRRLTRAPRYLPGVWGITLIPVKQRVILQPAGTGSQPDYNAVSSRLVYPLSPHLWNIHMHAQICAHMRADTKTCVRTGAGKRCLERWIVQLARSHWTDALRYPLMQRV